MVALKQYDCQKKASKNITKITIAYDQKCPINEIVIDNN